jgi:hypothetical protein
VTAIFDDRDNDVYPLWGRIVASFPPDRLKTIPKTSKNNSILPSDINSSNSDSELITDVEN